MVARLQVKRAAALWRHVPQLLRDPLFLAAGLLYATNRFVLLPLMPVVPRFQQDHFNDLLLIPVALPIILTVYQWLGLRPNSEGLPRWDEVLGHLVLWTVICEWLGPAWLGVGTADPIDAMCYALGAFLSGIYWGLRRRRQPL